MTFAQALEVLGVTEEQINQANAEAGVVEIAETRTEVRPSPIHGKGLFARSVFFAGEWIVPCRLGPSITHLGMASNHASPGNAVLVRFPGGDLWLRAARVIEIGEEVTHDYTVCQFNTTEEPSLP